MTLSVFITGLILFMVSIMACVATRDKIHPGVIFPFVWAITLIVAAFLPLIGFFPIEGGALLFFLVGGLIFSFVSICTHYLLNKRVTIPTATNTPHFSSNYLGFFLFFMNIIVFYFAINGFMALGSNVSHSAYMARRLSVQGEHVFNPIVSNYMLLGLVVIPILTLLLIKKKLNLVPYLIISFPWLALILLLDGRSGLIQLLLVLFFIYYLLVRKITLKVCLYIGGTFILIVVAGAVAVNKVDITSVGTFNDLILVFIKHVTAYVFQGPILFSQYFDGQVVVSPNWSPFMSIQHILSLLGFSPPPSPQLEFNHYGYESDMVGNVYSLYFSLYPNNGLLGAFLVLIDYSVASTYIYVRAKAGELVFILLSGYLFSAMVLSIFSDFFLTNFWFFIKLIIIVIFLKFVMQITARFYWFKKG